MVVAATVSGLNKDFPIGDEESIRVLFDINLEIRMGELTMLVGPSGCGKTTLISIISGILSSSSGKVTLLGHDVTHMPDKEKVLFRRTHLGFIFQQYNLLPTLTAAENAAIPLLAAGAPDRKAIGQARKLLEQIGLSGHTEKLPRALSGGQQQRVAIARALVHNPQMIVCDEPTAALDAKTGHAVMDILKAISQESQRAVLIVTHDNRIYDFADRILEMSDGRITGDGSATDFIHKEPL